MGKNTFTPPSVQHVQSEGGALQTIGLVIAAIGLIIGIVVMVSGGSPSVFLLLPIGLLTAITGYVKQIAAATSATYLLAMNAATTTEEVPAPQD